MESSVDDACRWYREAEEASRSQRNQVREDIAFSDPSDPQQWDEKEQQQRERDPGGARPCLVFDQTGQYGQNVTGQVEQQPPGLHAIPAGGGADRKVAEQLDGFFRTIEHVSRAQQHYVRALASAVRSGVGYLIVRPEYVDRALNWQEPRISSEGDPLRVMFDPWSVEIDGSDATRGQLLTPLSYYEFERLYGAKQPKISFGDEKQTTITDNRQSVLVAEEWRIEDQWKNMVICADPQGGEMSLTEDDFWLAKHRDPSLQPIGTFRDKQRVVFWTKLSGDSELVKRTEYPASGIGIVPVYGYTSFKDGRLKFCGIPRRARAAQQAYNFHMSEMRVLMKQAPKAPWIAAAEAIAPYKDMWDKADVESRAALVYNHKDADGNPIPAPQRMPNATNLQNHIAGALQAREDIQAALGMYAANIGKQSNAQSGVAYDAQKQQGEASTAFFPGNLGASLGQVGKLVLEMVPRLIDTQRQIRILGADGTPGEVRFNPKQPQAIQETDAGLQINPNIGRYDIRVQPGSSFATQRQESNAALTEMVRANPELMPVVGPLWAQTLDFPNADKLAQVLTAVAPPAVQAILNPGADKQPKTADLLAQIDQLKKALQEATQIAHEAQQDADEANDKLNAKDAENQIKAYEAETNRLKVVGGNEEQIQLIVQQLLNQMLSSPAPLGDESYETAVPAIPQEAQEPLGEEPQGDLPPQEPEMAAQEPQPGMEPDQPMPVEGEGLPQ